MRLKSIILENFRCYDRKIRIPMEENITAFIGKNDAGKSTVLEALDIFFGNAKMQQDDSSINCGHDDVLIGCIFDDLPDVLTVDTSSETSLANEYLLNGAGDLEIHKKYNCVPKNVKPTVFASAIHPVNPKVNNLLHLKNGDLKKLAQELAIAPTVDRRSNVELRTAIWGSFSEEDLQLEETTLQLNKEDAKRIWDSLCKYLPIFALFKSDRSSTDDDSEVQDPMKLAIDEAIQSVQEELDNIKQVVQQKATEVAEKTLEKLKEMDATLANNLTPNFKAEPRWSSLFKLSLVGDDQIPINKRGSGVRRLVLINFFRAQAENRQLDADAPGIIYAIEEPETSQHPSNQKMLLDALADLAYEENSQVILTTHVPGLAGRLPLNCLRYIDKDIIGYNKILQGSEEVYCKITDDLGVIADSRLCVLVCVEGPNDVQFLTHISRTIHQEQSALPSLGDDNRVALFPLGGTTLIQWVERNYLKNLDKPEVHIYDSDVDKYQESCDQVNQRADGSWATLTGKRTMENYLHSDVISSVYGGISVSFDDADDVPLFVAEAVHNNDSSSSDWDSLDDTRIRSKKSKVKKKLNNEGAKMMTYDQIVEVDTEREIEGWLGQISSYFE